MAVELRRSSLHEKWPLIGASAWHLFFFFSLREAKTVCNEMSNQTIGGHKKKNRIPKTYISANCQTIMASIECVHTRAACLWNYAPIVFFFFLTMSSIWNSEMNQSDSSTITVSVILTLHPSNSPAHCAAFPLTSLRSSVPSDKVTPTPPVISCSLFLYGAFVLCTDLSFALWL